MRSLSPEEAELWSRVAVTIRPLLGNRKPAFSPDQPKQPPRAGNAKIVPRAIGVAADKPHPIDRRTLDGTWDKKLRDGSIRPDRTIDLHGMNLDAAWTAIDRGLDHAVAGGERLVLLITGHRRVGDPPLQRGRIRAAVHDWLAASRHAGDIAAVRGAHPRHGGGGSLYLILRRATRHR